VRTNWLLPHSGAIPRYPTSYVLPAEEAGTFLPYKPLPLTIEPPPSWLTIMAQSIKKPEVFSPLPAKRLIKINNGKLPIF